MEFLSVSLLSIVQFPLMSTQLAFFFFPSLSLSPFSLPLCIVRDRMGLRHALPWSYNPAPGSHATYSSYGAWLLDGHSWTYGCRCSLYQCVCVSFGDLVEPGVF